MRDIYSDYVHAIRFALEGKPQEASLLAKRSLSSLSKTSPELAHVVTNLLAQFSSAKPVRGNVAGALPDDSRIDSRIARLFLLSIRLSPMNNRRGAGEC